MVKLILSFLESCRHLFLTLIDAFKQSMLYRIIFVILLSVFIILLIDRYNSIFLPYYPIFMGFYFVFISIFILTEFWVTKNLEQFKFGIKKLITLFTAIILLGQLMVFIYQTDIMNKQSKILEKQTTIIEQTSAPVDPVLRIFPSGFYYEKDMYSQPVYAISEPSLFRRHFSLCVVNRGLTPTGALNFYLGNDNFLKGDFKPSQIINLESFDNVCVIFSYKYDFKRCNTPDRCYQKDVFCNIPKECIENIPRKLQNITFVIHCQNCPKPTVTYAVPICIWGTDEERDFCDNITIQKPFDSSLT